MDQRQRRRKLQEILEEILGSDEVHYQPPTNIQLTYPCIVYNRDDGETEYADNKPYLFRQRYQVTYIDRDPESAVPAKIAELPMCTFDRFYASDDLNHDVYNIFF